MNTLVKAMAVLLFAAGLTSCATPPKSTTEETLSQTGETQVEGIQTGGTQVDDSSKDAVVGEVEVSGLAAGAPFARNAINDSASPLNKKIIYFEFDQSTVPPEYLEVVNSHATYLFYYTDVKVRLEGHADERGTREYNIALGERRAAAVRQLLLLQGGGADQISIISYGEELPAALVHDENSWGLNRRVEIVYEVQ
jgi:peptidoglycan-associated lipoprotein